MKRKLLALAIFVGFGLLKLPLEVALAARLHAHGLLSKAVEVGKLENLGQMGLAASLGGLRSLVASITYLQAYTAFEDVNWAKVDSYFQLTTRLQPNHASYWDEAAWHMAYNAASAYKYDEKIPLMIRGGLYQRHVQRGIEILQEGLRYMPESGKLWGKLGEIYRDRSVEPAKAAECFLKGAANGGLAVYERFGAYELVKLGDPASLRRAYEILRHVAATQKHTPALESNLRAIEEKLGIPEHERIKRPPAPKPLKPRS